MLMRETEAPAGSPAAPLRNKKRTKAGVLVSSITLSDLQANFHYPTEVACTRLGVGLTILKRLCRKFGIQRWPYRSLLKAGKAPRHEPSSTPRSQRAPCSTPVALPRAKACSASASPASTSVSMSPLQYSEGSSAPCAEWAPFASAAQRLAVPTLPPSPPPPAASQLGGGTCPDAFLAAMQPVSQALPHLQLISLKRKQPLGGFSEMQRRPAGQAQPAAAGALPKSSSQLTLLLSAIDACERSTPVVPQPATPLEPREVAWAPLHHLLGELPRATRCEARPFSHSQHSSFQPLPTLLEQPAQEQAPAAPVLQELIALKAALLQRRQQRAQAADSGTPTPPVDLLPPAVRAAAASLLEALIATTQASSPASPALLGEPRCLQLAQKLVLVRAALQARIARKRAALARPPWACGLQAAEATKAAASFAAFQRLPSGPVPLAALAPPDLLEGMSASDATALHTARSLLAQYSV